MKRPCLIICLQYVLLTLCNYGIVHAQYSISGRVIEDNRVETPLYGVNILKVAQGTGTSTTIGGFFKLNNLPEGPLRLRISFLSYTSIDTTLIMPLAENQELVFRMKPDTLVLDELTVKGQTYSYLSDQAPTSTINVTAMPIHSVPKFMGEPDLLRVIQNMPGVKAESDFTGGFYVRGGRNDQNLILLDGVPIYNPWHLFGIFSSFNMEALESVNFSKGVFPVQYGSRVSSVLDVELQDGSTRLGAGSLNVSLLSSSFSYGRPVNQNTSYLISLRRTYMDPVFWTTDRLNSTESYRQKNRYNFGDFNFKVAHRFSPRTKLEIGSFLSSDQLRFESHDTFDSRGSENPNRFQIGWRNYALSARLNHIHGDVVIRQQLFLSRYDADNQDRSILTDGDTFKSATERDITDIQFNQRFRDLGYQIDINAPLGDRISVSVGAQSIHHQFQDEQLRKGKLEVLQSAGSETSWNIADQFSESSSKRTISFESSAYVAANIEFGAMRVIPGVRLQHFQQGNVLNILPRFNVQYQATERILLTGGYGESAQYLHILGNELAQLPTDRWFWSDATTPPVVSQTLTAGGSFQINASNRITVEGYLRRFDNLRAYTAQQLAGVFDTESSIPLFSDISVEGSGRSQGVELLAERTDGKLNGWLGYTISWSTNRFDELNLGRTFYMRTDRRHDLQLFGNYAFHSNWSAGFLFNLKSGQPVTFGQSVYVPEGDPLQIQPPDIDPDPIVINRRNNHRLPAYHRLDLMLTWRNRTFLGRPAEWALNVINIYNRLNVFAIDSRTLIDELPDGSVRVLPRNEYTSQLPIIPMLNVRIALGEAAL